MRHALLALAVAALLAAGALAVSPARAGRPPRPDPDKPRARAFVLTDQNGEKVILSRFQGLVVVLEWMNPDCPFSRRHYEEGTFKDLAKTYKYGIPGQPDPQPAPRGRRQKKKRPKVIWLAVNSTYNGSVEANKKAAQEFAVPYPILDDHLGKVGRLYGAKTTPHVFVIAPNGNIWYHGAIDNDPEGTAEADERVNYVQKALEAVLSAKEPDTPQTQPYGCTIKYAKQR